MKLAMWLLVAALSGPQIAHAEEADEVLHPPSGPVYVVDAPGHAPRVPRAPRANLRRMLVDAFDANRNGKLEPPERKQLRRAIRKLDRKLARGDQKRPRRDNRRPFIERHDRNGDGHVGPDEMPPKAARRLRHLDRDRDGWVEPHE